MKRVFRGPQSKTHAFQNASTTVSAVVELIACNRHSFEKRSTMTRMFKMPLRDLGSGPTKSKATLSRGARAAKGVSGFVRFRSAIHCRAQEEHCRTVW